MSSLRPRHLHPRFVRTGSGSSVQRGGQFRERARSAPGFVVSFYMTGLGQTSLPLSDGTVATGIANATLPVTVTIGGPPAQVLYAGAESVRSTPVPSGLPNGGDRRRLR